MADQFTTTRMTDTTTPADTDPHDEPQPAPGEPAPGETTDTAPTVDRDPSDEAQGRGVDPADADGTPDSFVARMAEGKLTRADDRDRVNGRLGGTRDDRELARARYDESGGIRPDEPITNPLGPADTANADEHPSLRQLRLERERERENNEAF